MGWNWRWYKYGKDNVKDENKTYEKPNAVKENGDEEKFKSREFITEKDVSKCFTIEKSQRISQIDVKHAF